MLWKRCDSILKVSLPCFDGSVLALQAHLRAGAAHACVFFISAFLSLQLSAAF
jgi:hypothetical protein